MISLNLLAEKYKNDPFKFLYLIEYDYSHFWNSFEAADKDSNVLIIKGKRKRYLAVKNEDSNTSWIETAENEIDKILSGSGNFKAMLKKLNLKKALNEDL